MTTQPRSNRIHSIDALRGLAIFGIFVVNIFVFHASYAHYGPFYYALEGAEVQVVQWMSFLFAGKFMFIFAFLFGYGCWMQFEKYESPVAFRKFWKRRMLILAGFGIAHIVFLSMGDILFAYALLGLTLPFFVKFKNKTLLLFFLIIYLIPFYEFLLRPWLALDESFMSSKYSMEEYIKMNLDPNFWQLIKLRIYDFFSFRNEKLIMYMPKELSLFLLGIIAARRQLAQKLPKEKALLFCLVGLALALIWHFYRTDILGLFNLDNMPQRIIVGLLIQGLEFMHGLSYILGFWLLWSLKPFAQLFSFFRYVGKMSLTNYLLQSLIAFFLFTGYGLGWYAQLQPSELIVLAVAIFVLQGLFSFFWLKMYRFGPLEGLWRRWSYR